MKDLVEELGENTDSYEGKDYLPFDFTKQMMSIREAMFSIPETIALSDAENRICRVPTVSCPPAIPIAVPGELITKNMIEIFEFYGIAYLDVVKK